MKMLDKVDMEVGNEQASPSPNQRLDKGQQKDGTAQDGWQQSKPLPNACSRKGSSGVGKREGFCGRLCHGRNQSRWRERRGRPQRSPPLVRITPAPTRLTEVPRRTRGDATRRGIIAEKKKGNEAGQDDYTGKK